MRLGLTHRRSEDAQLMTAAHEIGVALRSTVATAGTGHAGCAAGYRAGRLAATCLMGTGTGISLLMVPAIRPTGADRRALRGG